MELDILNFINIFRVINDLKNKYGYSIIKRTEDFLKGIKENKLSFLDNEIWLLNTFYKYGITNIEDILSFIDSVKDIYRYDSIIEWLEYLKDTYYINKVCFVNNEKVKNIESGTLNRVFGKVFSKSSFDSENGLYNLKVLGNEPFVVLNVDNGDKTLYVSDFRINSFKMDVGNIMKERSKVLLEFLNSLSDYNNVILVINGEGLNIVLEDNLIKIQISEEFYNYIKDNLELSDFINKLSVQRLKI